MAAAAETAAPAAETAAEATQEVVAAEEKTKTKKTKGIPRRSVEAFCARFPRAIALGWYIAQEYPDHPGYRHCYFVYPPKEFHCRYWADMQPGVVYWAGMEIQVPSWFWEDDVMTTGTRKQ